MGLDVLSKSVLFAQIVPVSILCFEKQAMWQQCMTSWSVREENVQPFRASIKIFTFRIYQILFSLPPHQTVEMTQMIREIGDFLQNQGSGCEAHQEHQVPNTRTRHGKNAMARRLRSALVGERRPRRCEAPLIPRKRKGVRNSAATSERSRRKTGAKPISGPTRL